VGSPVDASDGELVTLGKMLKKNSVAVSHLFLSCAQSLLLSFLTTFFFFFFFSFTDLQVL
jgi:hypothetical protein